LNIFAQKARIFVNFCKFLAIFDTFLHVFSRFSFAYPTQTIQVDPPSPIFTPKSNIPLKKTSKNPIFSKNQHNFIFQFCAGLPNT